MGWSLSVTVGRRLSLVLVGWSGLAPIASRLEAIASGLDAIASRLNTGSILSPLSFGVFLG